MRASPRLLSRICGHFCMNLRRVLVSLARLVVRRGRVFAPVHEADARRRELFYAHLRHAGAKVPLDGRVLR